MTPDRNEIVFVTRSPLGLHGHLISLEKLQAGEHKGKPLNEQKLKEMLSDPDMKLEGKTNGGQEVWRRAV